MALYHQLIDYGITHGLCTSLDALYLNNRLAHVLGVPCEPYEASPFEGDIDAVCDALAQTQALAVGEADQFKALLLDFLTPLPSVLNERFWMWHEANPQHATAQLYELMRLNTYIQEKAVSKNRHFDVASVYGNIHLTINLSKPEKDPKVIAALKDHVSTDYPLGMLVKENMGYYGHLGYPARSHHRIIPLTLNDEAFYLQFSPYVYYEEHVIVFHHDFVPMDIGAKTWRRLFDFVDLFPHYFLGSNAGLPIVGGSILNHEHYQGGKARFPIESAQVKRSFTHNDVLVERLFWPVSVMRLSGIQRQAVMDCAEALRLFYQDYSDPSVELIAHTDAPHNTINPIVRKDNGRYVILIALRNNRTSAAYPDGIFHLHPDVYAIKKENIGLIEVMGLAILPPRHEAALHAMVQDEGDYAHKELYESWAQSFDVPKPHTQENLLEGMGRTFVRGLEDVGVFKTNTTGEAAFDRFMDAFIASLES